MSTASNLRSGFSAISRQESFVVRTTI